MKIYLKSANFRNRVTMIERTSTTLSRFFNDDDIEVANILLNLPILIAKSEARWRWGKKKKRSVLNESPPQSASQKTTCLVVDQSDTERRRPKVVGAETSSPATPLSFSPSESDEKQPKLKHYSHNKKASKTRSREELLQIIDLLTLRKQILTWEVAKVRRHHEGLKATNLAIKQQLNFHREREGQIQLETCQNKNLGMELGQANVRCPTVENQRHGQGQIIPLVVHHQRTLVVNQTVYGSPMSKKFQCTRDQMLQFLTTSASRAVPHGVCDLNVSPKESLVIVDSPQPLDLTRVVMENRAKAAEARRRRMIKIKEMKYFGTIKPPRFK